QLVNSNSNQMLIFHDYCVRPDVSHSTKYPKWFDTLQIALLSNSSSRETVSSFPHVIFLRYDFPLHMKNKNKNVFVVGWHMGDNKPFVGQLLKVDLYQ
ncbi:1700_t:CDS:1, partial [Funneliformis geosporum]